MSSSFSGKSLPVQASGQSDVSEEEVACSGNKKKKLIYQGPLAKLVTIDRFAAYAGFTTGAIRKMCLRGILPAHQMKNPNNPEGKVLGISIVTCGTNSLNSYPKLSLKNGIRGKTIGCMIVKRHIKNNHQEKQQQN